MKDALIAALTLCVIMLSIALIQVTLDIRDLQWELFLLTGR